MSLYAGEVLNGPGASYTDTTPRRHARDRLAPSSTSIPMSPPLTANSPNTSTSPRRVNTCSPRPCRSNGRRARRSPRRRSLTPQQRWIHAGRKRPNSAPVATHEAKGKHRTPSAGVPRSRTTAAPTGTSTRRCSPPASDQNAALDDCPFRPVGPEQRGVLERIAVEDHEVAAHPDGRPP